MAFAEPATPEPATPGGYEITNIKTSSNGSWQFIISDLNITNPSDKIISVPPTDHGLDTINIFVDEIGYSHFISEFRKATLCPISIFIYSLTGNLISRFPADRTCNEPGNVIYHEEPCKSFSSMNISAASIEDGVRNFILFSSLKNYQEMVKKQALFDIDIETFNGNPSIHVITTEEFNGVSLESYFENVTKGRSYSNEIKAFVQDYFGIVFSSSTNEFWRRIPCDGNFSIVQTTSTDINVSIRSDGLHIRTNKTGEISCKLIAVSSNTTHIDGNPISLPYIVADDKKQILKDITDLARITSNIHDVDDNLLESLMEDDRSFRRFVLCHIRSKQLLPTDTALDETFNVVKKILDIYWGRFISLLTHQPQNVSTSRRRHIDSFGPMRSIAPIRHPGIHREISHF